MMSSQEQPGSVPQAVPNSGTAIVSLIFGILGLTFFPLIGSIVALITGYSARNEIKESMGTLGGDGMATAGIVMGWVGIGLALIGCCVFGFIFTIPACLIPFGIFSEGSWSLLPVIISPIV